MRAVLPFSPPPTSPIPAPASNQTSGLNQSEAKPKRREDSRRQIDPADAGPAGWSEGDIRKQFPGSIFLTVSILLLTALTAFPPAAFSQTAKTKLVGHWEAQLEADDAKLMTLLKNQSVPDSQIDTVIETVKKKFASMRLTLSFNADGTYEFEIGKDANQKGTWELIEEKENTVKVSTKSSEAQSKAEIGVYEFDGNDKFSYIVNVLKTAPIKKPLFKRKK